MCPAPPVARAPRPPPPPTSRTRSPATWLPPFAVEPQMRDPRDVALAAQLACLIEVSTPKPGNVHPQADFADTRYEGFVASALAIGDAMGQAHRMGVGKIVWAGVRDTRRRGGGDTNLGLVLLLGAL